jgi:hypothetical protein
LCTVVGIFWLKQMTIIFNLYVGQITQKSLVDFREIWHFRFMTISKWRPSNIQILPWKWQCNHKLRFASHFFFIHLILSTVFINFKPIFMKKPLPVQIGNPPQKTWHLFVIYQIIGHADTYIVLCIIVEFLREVDGHDQY